MIAQDVEAAASYLRARFPESSTSPTARRCREAISTLERAALDARMGEDAACPHGLAAGDCGPCQGIFPTSEVPAHMRRPARWKLWGRR